MDDQREETQIQKDIREDLEKKKNQAEQLGKDFGSQIGVDSQKYDPINLALADYFELKPEDWESYRDKLNIIREWAEITARSKDRLEVLSALKYLETTIAPPLLTENRLKNLYRWIRLDLDQKRIEKEKELYQK